MSTGLAVVKRFLFIFLIMVFVILPHTNARKYKQERAKLMQVNKKYMKDAELKTLRKGRGSEYRTYFTGTTLYPFTNNVTFKLLLEFNGYTMEIKKRICEIEADKTFQWLVDSFNKHANDKFRCPLPAKQYKIMDVEMPPKGFPVLLVHDTKMVLSLVVTSTNEVIAMGSIMLRVV